MSDFVPCDSEHSRRVLRLPAESLETQSRVVLRDHIHELCDWCGPGTALPSPGQTVDWSHANVNISECRKKHRVSGAGVRVAILDTGVDGRHLDLRVVEGVDFTRSPIGWYDGQGHGTHVTGIVAAQDNGVGSLGVSPDAQIYAVKVLSDTGEGTFEAIESGIRWAISRKVHVINMSLGGDGPISPGLRRAIDEAIDCGIIVCVAAGNSGPYDGTVGNPGNYARCVTVGATDRSNQPAQFTSRGPTVDVAAPGVDILSTYPNNRTTRLSGTSMATPLVTGVAALYVEKCLAVGVTPTHAEFERLAKETARDVYLPGHDTATGYGLLQPTAILDAVDAACPPIPDPPIPDPPIPDPPIPDPPIPDPPIPDPPIPDPPTPPKLEFNIITGSVSMVTYDGKVFSYPENFVTKILVN